jgi:hypothetical protein
MIVLSRGEKLDVLVNLGKYRGLLTSLSCLQAGAITENGGDRRHPVLENSPDLLILEASYWK